ncbi:MAG: hypothetical protein O2960_07065 [Verrucomicrobia bacterium]|nr:hypothetical protein [Verrucomicrobiota bacterium]
MNVNFIKSKERAGAVVFALALVGFLIVSLTKTDPVFEIETSGGSIDMKNWQTSRKMVWLDKLVSSEVSRWISRKFQGRGAIVGMTLPAHTTDEYLALLDDLPRLERLSLNNANRITDTGLRHLKDLDELWTLDLRGTQTTDAGLVHLAGLRNLRSLYLGDTQVTDARVLLPDGSGLGAGRVDGGTGPPDLADKRRFLRYGVTKTQPDTAMSFPSSVAQFQREHVVVALECTYLNAYIPKLTTEGAM